MLDLDERRSRSRRVRNVLGDRKLVNDFRAHGRFWDRYTIGALLGSGNFAQVFLCCEQASGKQYAVKMMTVEDSQPGSATGTSPTARTSRGPGVGTSASADILKEVEVLASCVGVQGTTQLHEFFDDCHPDASWPVVYVVLELVRGSELVDVVASSRGTLTEDQARGVLRQLFATLARLHDLRIVHRDIKHANIMLPFGDVFDKGLKLIDMGLALRLDDKEADVQPCGTPISIAPEVLKAKVCGTPADVWSCGILLYTLLCGCPPFYHKDIGELFQSIVRTAPNFSGPQWLGVSDDAIRLIRMCLNPNPEARITAKEALLSAWVTNTGSEAPPQTMNRSQSYGTFV